jgi:EAL domain-containing protein (putative c-di-GMP-specific phosphodiesterase class I)
MRNADIAMYLAKGQGKHQAEVFRPTLHADIVQRLGLRTDLERAIAEGEFVLHYQPLVRLADGATIGAEALVRWAHPTRGLVLPGEFIPAAESTGLIVPLGRWILDESVRQAAVWLREFERPIAMSVNLSAIQLEDPRLVDDVRAALERHALPPSSLVVEVTESRVLDTEAIIATLDRIKALGVRVAIDDFGTGYSSFSCLARLTADYLKVDRSFVGAIGTERREGTVGGAIVQLGSSLGLATVAEGIETPEQLERLRELGVPYGQGFLLARPMPATELGRRLADTNAAERAASPVPGALGRGPGIARHGYSAA